MRFVFYLLLYLCVLHRSCFFLAFVLFNCSNLHIWPLLFNIISLQLQGNVHSLTSVRVFLSLQNRMPIPGPPSTRLLPLWRIHCFHTVYLEYGISVLGTETRQKESYPENMGVEKGFQIHMLPQQSRQLVTCEQGYCPARADYRNSVFLISFLRFPGVAASIRLHNMHELSCDLAHDNQSVSPLDYPKILRPLSSLLNETS